MVRNLQITQCYHELSSAMAALTGPLANWCTFATWASKQAGQSIRKEDLARTFENLLTRSRDAASAMDALADAGSEAGGRHLVNVDAIREALRQALSPAAAFERVSDAIARGNRKVFEEIGREFARFLALCENGALDDAIVAEFCDGLRPGEPPDGQRYLRQAFGRYSQALAETDAKRKCELMLLANIEIGFHEQTRLQPEIVEALDAPLPDLAQLREDLLEALAAQRSVSFTLWQRPDLGQSRAKLAKKARRLARQTITEHMMTLRLSEDQAALCGPGSAGQLPARPSSRSTIPTCKPYCSRSIPPPTAYAAQARTIGANLPDRLHFIADMFRAYEEDGGLLGPPFTLEQVMKLKAGQRPAGRL